MLSNNFLLEINWTCLWPLLLLAGLIPFILGAILGCILCGSRGKQQLDEVTRERDRYHNQFTEMEKNFMSLKYDHEQLSKDNNALHSSLQKAEADMAVLQAKAEIASRSAGGAAMGATGGRANKGIGAYFTNDNLQIVEGIGPKVEKLLHEKGTKTWNDLRLKSVEELRSLLAAASLQMMNPDTWPHQARLAAEGKWDELVEYQKFLDTGREKAGDFENPSKVETLAMKLMGFRSNNPEDLKIVEGIGPKIEELLKNSGIKTWADLAAASLERIQAVLDTAGDRYRLADPQTWPKQAGLAAEGKWAELKEYQNFLDGGKNPG